MKKVVMISLAVALWALLAGTGAAANPLPDRPHVYIEGSAEIEVVPDQMSITLGLEATNQKLAVAKQDVDERSRRLIAACKALGIAPEDLATTALQVSPAYDWRNGEQVPLGTRVYRQVDITLRDLNQYTEFMAALVDAEISNTVSTQLEVSNEDELADKALEAAIADARQRAEGMARSLGKRLGEAHSVSEFNTRVNERHQLFTTRGITGDSASAMPEAAMARGGDEPFEPGLLIARAQVYVVFYIR